ncbi:acyltransferase family protein [Flavobacterium laiguense]|uniref:Acyltransferase 3 domain-containing protein n=1 Tax=Flavobacterium laiguense TaxID=2169409 RepID=A0A2U1JYR7_9FLAO|nr:acyltransferase [Flavobacterium laiguense]PWA09913.1 hypothetical protein DB891_07005 [Flavobacterium laiguense]
MRDSNIDFYRGLAVIGVIILHAWMTIPGIGIEFPNLHIVMSRFSVSMQLFFVISGYLIYSSFNYNRNIKGFVGNFYIKRMSKIIPLYLIFLGLNLAVFLLLNYMYKDFDNYSMYKLKLEHITKSNFIAHLFFLQGFSAYRLHSLLDGSWSIVIEVYFYLLFPFFVYNFVNTKKKSILYFLLSLGLLALFPKTIGLVWDDINIGSFYYYYFTNQFPCFILGIVLFHYKDCFFDTKVKLPFLILSATIFMGMLHGSIKPIDYHIFYSIGIIFFIISSYETLSGFKEYSIYKYIANIGTQSYAIFFLHLIIMNVSVFFLNRNLIGVNPLIVFVINLLVIFLTSYILSNFIFNKIDVYFCKLGKKLVVKTITP